MSVTIFYEALEDLQNFVEALPGNRDKAARMAINQVAERKAVPLARMRIAAQVEFPQGYLNEDRLGVTRRATDASLEAVITGRARPTSLARFVAGNPKRGQKLSVTIKKGMPRELQGAFLINLKSGNTGLAVRLKAGSSLRNSRGAVKMNAADNLYLLYGPSVDQVFRTVATDISPELGDAILAEFLRQFNRLNGES